MVIWMQAKFSNVNRQKSRPAQMDNLNQRARGEVFSLLATLYECPHISICPEETKTNTWKAVMVGDGSNFFVVLLKMEVDKTSSGL